MRNANFRTPHFSFVVGALTALRSEATGRAGYNSALLSILRSSLAIFSSATCLHIPTSLEHITAYHSTSHHITAGHISSSKAQSQRSSSHISSRHILSALKISELNHRDSTDISSLSDYCAPSGTIDPLPSLPNSLRMPATRSSHLVNIVNTVSCASEPESSISDCIRPSRHPSNIYE